MRIGLKPACSLLASAMLLAGCGTLRLEHAAAPGRGSPATCRTLGNLLAAETDQLRRLELTEGMIRAGCIRRPAP